jgi:hypothetical protein
MANFDRNTLRASLQAVPNNIMPHEQMEIMISLFQMLNDTNPGVTNEICEHMFANFIIPIFNNSDLDPQNKINQINEAMIQMAETTGTPIEDETETLKIALKIAWYRNAALYSLATGATIADVQAMFPGAFLFIFDQAYSIYQYLIAKGISAADIAAKVATDPSPFAPDSPGPFAAGPFAEAFLNAVSGAVSSAFFACANVAAEVGSAAIRSIPDATKLAIEAAGFAATVSLAGIVVGKVVAAGKVVLDATTGKYDRAAAEWLKRGGMKRTQDAIKAAVRATKATAINIVEYTKDTIIAAINGFVEVTNGMRDPSRAPNRFAAAHVNTVILNWLDIYMSRFRDLPDVNIILSNLVNALATIDYSSEAARNTSIEAAARALGVNLDEINDPLTKAFWSVIIANILAVDKKNKLTKSVSLGFPGESYREPKPLVETGRSVSGVDRQIFIEDPDDPYRSYYRQKGQENVGTWTEQTVADIAANNIFSSAKMNESIKDLYKNDPEFKKAMQDVGMLPIIAQQKPEDQERIVAAINATPTKIITGTSEERKRKIEENKGEIIRSIERKLTEIQAEKIAGLKASLPQSRIEDIFHEAGPARTINEEKYRSQRQTARLKAADDVRKEEARLRAIAEAEEAARLRAIAEAEEAARLQAIASAIKQTEEDDAKSFPLYTGEQGNKKSKNVKNPDAMEEELGGSRRRHRKSRRYKKKKTTLKRRQMKRRRTRKGKKRRHTKKR